MRIKIALIAALVLAASAAAASGPHETMIVAEAKGTWRGFEFTKTREFVKEMESRPDFPVSTPLAYDYVYSLKALGEPVKSPRKKTLLQYLKKAQQKDGGFSSDKANTASSSLYTDITLETIALLQPARPVENDQARRFILSLKNSDGGFGFSASSRDSTIMTTYYAVKSLAAMKGLGAVDKAKTTAFVKAFERKDTGGFGLTRGKGIATAKTTYMALYTLNALGTLDEETKKDAQRFLEGTPCGKNGSTAVAELNEVAYAVQGANLLKVKKAIDGRKVKEFLRSVYIPVNGGFAPLEGYGASPDSTATALRIFAESGGLHAPAAGR